MRIHRAARVSAFVIVALVLQLALSGSPSGPLRPVHAAPAPDLTIGVLQTIDSLNPYIGITESSYLLYGLLYDYPFSYDQDGNSVPNLILDASCDVACMNWTYTVRQGVYWSDGTELTAADVAFTWNFDSQHLYYLWAFEPYFNQVVRCTGSNQGQCGAVITAPWQVTVFFQRPFVAGRNLFAPILQEAQWSAVSPQAAETTYQNANPIGTGPFIADPNIYAEWQQQTSPGVSIHVYRNPNYHPVGARMGPSNISDLYIRVFSDVNTMALSLEAGTIQLAAMNTDGIAAVQGLPNILTQTPLQANQQWNEIGITQIDTLAADARLNPARFDVNVRRAMAYATNKDYIVKTAYHGQGQRGDTLISPITPDWWYDPTTGGDNLTYDLTHANAVLDAAGWTGTWSDGTNVYRLNPSALNTSYQPSCYQCMDPPNVTKTIPAGTHLEFTIAVRPTSQFPEETNTANYLVTSFRSIGIKLDLKVETTEMALATDVYSGYVEMYIWYWSGDPDPNYLLSMQSSWTLDGWSDNYWNNASYNHAYISELGDLNLTQRIADAKAAQKIQYETAVYIIYIYPFGQWAMRTDLWQGWGDWSAHPYRQMVADWGANPLWFDLNCPTCVSPPVNYPPTAPVIGGSPYITTQTYVTNSFTATSSDPEQTDTLNFTWDWGDGRSNMTTTSASNPVSTAEHSWSATGNYTVSVRVSDGWNSPVYSQADVHVNVTAPLVNPGTFKGYVKDSSGQALAGAQVYTSPGSLFDVTDASGSYTILVPAGTYDVTASKTLYLSQTKPGTVASGETIWINFTLTPVMGWLTGTVTSSVGGAPISGATVLANSSTGTMTAIATDAQGRYNLSLAPDAYTVSASAAGYLTKVDSGVHVASGLATVIDFALRPNRGWLVGRVTDSAGHGIASAVVRVTQNTNSVANTQTNATGWYNVSLAPGTYAVNVTATGYVSQTRTGEAITVGAETEADFVLATAPGRISGFVLAVGGAPIAGAVVAIGHATGSETAPLYSVVTDGQGAYLQSLAPGTYLLMISAPGYVSQNRTATVGPGQLVYLNVTLSAEPSSSPSPLSLAAIATLGGGIAIVVAAVVYLLVRRRKKAA